MNNSIDKSALRKDAMKYFDLKNGVISYLSIYDQITNSQSD
jgi:hypothetical protein